MTKKFNNNEEDLIILKKEIAKKNIIIDVLVKENEYLKQNISRINYELHLALNNNPSILKLLYRKTKRFGGKVLRRVGLRK